MTKDELTDRIKAKALELGFCEVGVTSAERLEPEASRLAQWLASGYHGTMDWMARNFEKRIDPRNILPEARSVVVTAMNYFTDVSHTNDPGVGKVSRYAWGDDYHVIVQGRLVSLLDFIRSIAPEVKGRAYVDTGPVLEKPLAQRAGIGWEGKHTNIITQRYGSWVFLGEIILDAELRYDSPATDHCGSCSLCIDACPTGAIVEPHVLDSQKCISYLTIENRGEIDPQLSKEFDNWIYGCDICQDVCPWNEKFAKPTDVKGFHPRADSAKPKLDEWASMSDEEFSRKFRSSPMKRTKRSGLVRNIGAVMRPDDQEERTTNTTTQAMI
jgi:epoxyqueuosine reductase